MRKTLREKLRAWWYAPPIPTGGEARRKTVEEYGYLIEAKPAAKYAGAPRTPAIPAITASGDAVEWRYNGREIKLAGNPGHGFRDCEKCVIEGGPRHGCPSQDRYLACHRGQHWAYTPWTPPCFARCPEAAICQANRSETCVIEDAKAVSFEAKAQRHEPMPPDDEGFYGGELGVPFNPDGEPPEKEAAPFPVGMWYPEETAYPLCPTCGDSAVSRTVPNLSQRGAMTTPYVYTCENGHRWTVVMGVRTGGPKPSERPMRQLIQEAEQAHKKGGV